MEITTTSKTYKFKILGAAVTVIVDSSYDGTKILKNTPDYVRWLHFHAMNEMFFIGDVPLTLLTEEGREEFSDCALLVPSYLKHMAFLSGGHRILFSIESSGAPNEVSAFFDGLCRSGTPVSIKVSASVKGYLKELGELFFVTNDKVADDMTASLLKLVFYGLYRENAGLADKEQHVSDDSYFIKIDTVIGNYRKDITLYSLAEELGISTRQTARIINERYKSTLSELLNQQRLGVARRLIEDGELSIAEIVEYVNFSSQSHFSKKFKEAFGVTPHAYKQSFKKTKIR